MLIEKVTWYGLNGSQQTVVQMTQVTCLDLPYLTATRQLAEDCIDEAANPSQSKALVDYRFGETEQSVQYNTFQQDGWGSFISKGNECSSEQIKLTYLRKSHKLSTYQYCLYLCLSHLWR